MKNILFLALLFFISFSTWAGSVTSDSHFITLQNSETTDAFLLNTETNRTEYRTERVQRTCYKTVFDGYRTVCNMFPIYPGLRSTSLLAKNFSDKERDGHRSEGRRYPMPYPNPAPTCHSEPVYRTVAYSCWQSVSVPYEVFDHSSSANINVKMSAAPETKQTSGDCGIRFDLVGDHLSPTNTCAQYIAIANKMAEGSGYNKNYSYSIHFQNSDVVLAPLFGNLEGLQLNGRSELVVKTGNLIGAKNYKLKLYVQRRKLLKKDIILINRTLTANEYTYNALDRQTGLVHINLKKLLGNFESDKKNRIQVDLDVSIESNAHIINSGLPALHQEASITIK